MINIGSSTISEIYIGNTNIKEAYIGGDLVYSSTTDLSLYDVYGNHNSRNTANCYVVKKTGTYKFPCVYGNAIKNGVANTAAYSNNGGDYSHDFVNYVGNQITDPWVSTDTGETIASAQLSIADTDGIFSNITVNKDYVIFTVDSVPATGANGVISIKDSAGTIMWNWHIWVWKDDLTPVTITNNAGVNYDILPVNLGSKWETDSTNPTQIKNWYYQWGRPNPIPLVSSYATSTNEPTLYGTYTSLTKIASASDFQTGIKNPNVFYERNSTSYNWFSSTSYYNLWDANCASTGASDNTTVKTIYDPSPVGFKVPNGNTFTGFTTTGNGTGTTSEFNVVGSFSNGWYFKKNSSDSIGVFFPVSGYRYHSSGDLRTVGSSGYCWSSAASSQNGAYRLSFTSSYISPLSDYGRAYGISVRCVAE